MDQFSQPCLRYVRREDVTKVNIWSNQGMQMKMIAITIVLIICVLTLVYIHYNRPSTIAMVIWTVPVVVILAWEALSPSWNKPFGDAVKPLSSETECISNVKEE